MTRLGLVGKATYLGVLDWGHTGAGGRNHMLRHWVGVSWRLWGTLMQPHVLYAWLVYSDTRLRTTGRLRGEHRRIGVSE